MKTLKIPVNRFQYFTVTGGPYFDRPANYRGVKMAVEIDKPCDVNIPTRDYNVPKVEQLMFGLDRAVDMLLHGEPLYVGCYGGVGRTGLFLGVLAKAFGIADPVAFVRAGYNPHAVETEQQKEYVANFQIDEAIFEQIRKATRFSWLRFWKRNLTVFPEPVATDHPPVAAAFPSDEWDEEVELDEEEVEEDEKI